MDERTYKAEFESVQRELQEIEDKRKECLSIKEKIDSEEEENEKKYMAIADSNREIKDDWIEKNLVTGKEYLFEEEESILRNISFERQTLWNSDFSDFKSYIDKLSWGEEDCKTKLAELRKAHESKREENDGSYY